MLTYFQPQQFTAVSISTTLQLVPKDQPAVAKIAPMKNHPISIGSPLELLDAVGGRSVGSVHARQRTGNKQFRVRPETNDL